MRRFRQAIALGQLKYIVIQLSWRQCTQAASFGPLLGESAGRWVPPGRFLRGAAIVGGQVRC